MLATHYVGDHGTITAVGDDDQSILRLRGAENRENSKASRRLKTLVYDSARANYRSTGR